MFTAFELGPNRSHTAGNYMSSFSFPCPWHQAHVTNHSQKISRDAGPVLLLLLEHGIRHKARQSFKQYGLQNCHPQYGSLSPD